MNIVARLGLAVWVKDLKAARSSLSRLGNVHYISKRLKYIYIYIDFHSAEQMIKRIERMPFVLKVEPSKRKDISLDFEHNQLDAMG
ncbi:YlbG family protein [Risungbinella massiliensis]|uniref:YlbG family protein n=1 Tax=Risungbinella massiliensis TaxID=1329796 RepID=UPI0005CC4FFE|nr:YlbG family protein [Risungbinella massiliensis]